MYNDRMGQYSSVPMPPVNINYQLSEVLDTDLTHVDYLNDE
jgi:hypothetical protein